MYYQLVKSVVQLETLNSLAELLIGPTITIRNSNRAGMILANKVGCKSSKLPSTQRWLSDCEIAGELKLEGNGLSTDDFHE